MYIVYVLKSNRDGRRYIGQTSDLKKRLMDHNDGQSRYTKNRGPWEVIFTEEASSRSEAVMRERFLKSGQGREFLKSLGK